MARLVAVRVLADDSGDVGLLAARHHGTGGEETVEETLHSCLPAHHRDVIGQVVGHIGGILPGVGFRVVVVDLRRIEGGDKAAVALAVHKAIGVKDVAVGLRAAVELVGHLLVAGKLGEPRNAPVVVGVLQRLGNRLVVGIAGHIAIHSVFFPPEFVERGAVYHCLQHLLLVVGMDALDVGVEDDRNGMVADHTPGLESGQLPDGQHSTLTIVLEERVEEILGALPVNDVEQWMQGPVGVPQGEDRIDLLALLHDLNAAVHSAVAAVDIRI